MPGFVNATAGLPRAGSSATCSVPWSRRAWPPPPRRANRDWHLMHMNAALAAGAAGRGRAAPRARRWRCGRDAADAGAARLHPPRSWATRPARGPTPRRRCSPATCPPTTRAALLADLGRTREARERWPPRPPAPPRRKRGWTWPTCPRASATTRPRAPAFAQADAARRAAADVAAGRGLCRHARQRRTTRRWRISSAPSTPSTACS